MYTTFSNTKNVKYCTTLYLYKNILNVNASHCTAFCTSVAAVATVATEYWISFKKSCWILCCWKLYEKKTKNITLLTQRRTFTLTLLYKSVCNEPRKKIMSKCMLLCRYILLLYFTFYYQKPYICMLYALHNVCF